VLHAGDVARYPIEHLDAYASSGRCRERARAFGGSRQRAAAPRRTCKTSSCVHALVRFDTR